MLNQTGITTKVAGTRKTILVDELNSTAFSVVVDATGVSADEDGKKILKAGTPMLGDLKNRNAAWKMEATNPNGILLHDVDVTGLSSGKTRNAQVVVFGFIDVSKVESDVQAMLTSSVEAKLKMIQFVK